MKFNKNISVKDLLIRSVLIIFILIIGIISAISIYIISENKKNDERTYSKTVLQKQVEKISFQFEKAVLVTQFIAANSQFSAEDSILLKKYFSKIVQSRKEISDLYFYKGNLNTFINKNENILQDTSNNFINLTVNKIGDRLFYSSYLTGNFDFALSNIDKIITDKGILISEPFKIKKKKKTENVINITSPVLLKNNVIGFISINYKITELVEFPVVDKSLNCSYILLSPAKNIIASTLSQQNIGKNILSLNGEERFIYDDALSNESNSDTHISELTINNSDITFKLLSECNIPVDKKYHSLFILFIIILSVSVVAGIVLIYFIINKSLLPLKKITEISDKISSVNMNVLNAENLNKEYKIIVENLKKITSENTEIINFAHHISSGNYNTYIKPSSEEDIVSISLNSISSHLKEEKNKRSKEEKEVERQLWMRKGRFEISEAERFSSKDITELSFNIIRSLVNYTDALMGGIYLFDEEQKNIELVAAYAYEKQKHFNANFKPGEGIVGACILEKKKIILNNIPDDYIKIATGLGSGTPSIIAVVPVFFKNKINAAIEIAFLKTPENYIIEFIEQLSDSIGAWIDASLISTKTAELLTVSQEQTQKLAEKEDELNKKVAELQEIQEKTDEINIRFQSILNAVNQTIMTVEYTTDGTIINCNEIYTRIMGFTADEIKGKNVTEIVKDQSESLKKIIEEVKKGKSVKQEVKRYTKTGEEKHLTATYTPYYDKEGNISQILFFAFDISNIDNKQ